MDTLLPRTIYYNEYKIKLMGTYDDTWVCANDICAILNYKPKSCHSAILSHVDENDRKIGFDLQKLYPIENFNKVHGRSYYVNEIGLLDLVCSCRLQSAKEFKKYFVATMRNIRRDVCLVDHLNIPTRQTTEFTNRELVEKLGEERRLKEEERRLKEEERRLKEEERRMKEEERKLRISAEERLIVECQLKEVALMEKEFADTMRNEYCKILNNRTNDK